MSTVVDLSALGSRGFSLQGGQVADELGWSVSGAGDVNGDGFDDVIVGAPYADGANTTSGAAYVIFGATGGLGSLDPNHLTAAQGFKIQGNGVAGLSVSGAGDVNGDGFDDVIVATYLHGQLGYGLTQAYVVFGKATPSASLDLGNLAASDGFKMSGPAESSYYGGYALRVSKAGDVNGDGFDDLVIGAQYANSEAGAAYVVFGKAAGFGTIDLTNLAASAGFTIVGAASKDLLGASVASAGDVNGDGYDDIIVGAPRGDLGGNDAGQAYVIFGKANGFGTINVTTLDGTAGFIIKGHNTNDSTGFSVSGAGDINGDGFDDIVIGAPFVSTDAAYVIFGKASGFGLIDLANLGTAGFTIQGSSPDGRSVSAAGDVNHDGFDDFIVGSSSAAYLIFGKPGGFGTVDLANLGPGAGFVLQGVQGSGTGWSVGAAGDVNRDGFADVIVGAPFSSANGTNSGQAFVVGVAPFAVDNDFNGDGPGDVLWRNDDGTLTNWLGQRGGGLASNPVYYNVPASWHVVGTGDFNGDARTDVLWQNDNGTVTNWLGRPGGGLASNPVYYNVPASWHIVGTGDINGDSRTDVLWQKDDGTITDWLGQPNGGLSSNPVYYTVPGSWHVRGTADFNGDGKVDVLWQNDNGTVTDWLGQPNGGLASNPVYYNVPASWHIVGTGDFNGDGFGDVLWRNDAGTITDWLGQPAGGLASNPVYYNVAASWHVTHTGDFNGDGLDDLVLRNDAGAVSEWLGQANGGFADNSSNVSVAVPLNWHVQDAFIHDPFGTA